MKPHSAGLPLRETKCATCPWREDSPYRYLLPHLTASALTEATRICHSTADSGIMGDTGKPAAVCRGARHTQLRHFAGIGFLEAPTDAAWAKKWEECQRR